MDFSKIAEDLWKNFFSKMSEETKDNIIEWFAPECVIIGTGAHEFYVGVDNLLASFSAEMAERNDIEFHFKSFSCEQMQLGPETCLVYGKFYVSGENEDKSVLVNMDSRFTLLFHNIETEWKLVHVHLSIPNQEQGYGEYYPKTLLRRVQELQSVNAELTELAQKDGLTAIDNFRTFSIKWEQRSKYGWIFVLDLDHFKRVNDTYGHLTGNEVLIGMARIFSSAVRENDLICRMGGDEFLIFCSEMKNKSDAADFAQRLINDIKNAGASKPYWTTVSIGAAKVKPDMSIEDALGNADKALYEVKRTRRGSFLTK